MGMRSTSPTKLCLLQKKKTSSRPHCLLAPQNIKHFAATNIGMFGPDKNAGTEFCQHIMLKGETGRLPRCPLVYFLDDYLKKLLKENQSISCWFSQIEIIFIEQASHSKA